MEFFISCDEILDRIDRIDPIQYSKSRNYKDGAISYLSPFISRGVISTKFIAKRILKKGYKFYEIEKFLQELAWRDYWQQVWIAKQEEINQDLKQPQTPIEHYRLPSSILNAKTGIEVVDHEIENLHKTGYMHNHMRMYVAGITCNMAHAHWKTPAKWMYYHLLDGDWASNALSWQWVAGANSNKKYVANQDNINKYFNSRQKNTFLDVDYSAFDDFKTPEILKDTCGFNLTTELPKSQKLEVNPNWDTCIYNYYNLDPLWKQEQKSNRILLLEPEILDQYPICQKCVDFMIHLSNNIKNIQVFVGSFDELEQQLKETEVYFKEHALNNHYRGKQCERDWMFSLKGYYPSFFNFWKKCKKELKNNNYKLDAKSVLV